ncbi:hypothetical protein [Actinopolymorpha sp. B9G3]|uniref:hypothetical protein n=1 Tax=Actinopolymorpha sp. B9G3 TaxID=3158970 RepID=UPI0032D98085
MGGIVVSWIRWARVTAAMSVVAVMAGCGTESPIALSNDVSLDVLVESAEISGDDGITVEALPAGTLRKGSMLWTLARLDADEATPIPGLVQFEGKAEREGGGAALGVTGTCGLGWTAKGKQMTGDPCAAAGWPMQIPDPDGVPFALLLYPTTDSGSVTSGTYRVSIPLDKSDGPHLDLTYRLIERGDADLPPWPDETVPWTLTFEPYAENRWRELRIRVEDVYGRVIGARDMVDFQGANPDLENDGVFTVDVPRGYPVSAVLLKREGEAWIRCGGGVDVVMEKKKWPTALLTEGCVK